MDAVKGYYIIQHFGLAGTVIRIICTTSKPREIVGCSFPGSRIVPLIKSLSFNSFHATAGFVSPKDKNNRRKKCARH
jgi:hypothetical protein